MLPPPSPALSACDSLDGIDDLEAFLASQGSLSHFPTPPLKRDRVVEAIEVLEELARREAATPDYDHISLFLAEQTSGGADISPEELVAIRRVLTRADLPLEISAIALNILTSIRAHSSTENLTDSPRDLLVAAALSLALSYTRDTPPPTSWWARHVCDCTWTTRRIDKTILELLVILDFRLHFCSDDSKLQAALLMLSVEADASVGAPNECLPESVHPLADKSLDLLVEGTSTLWQHGQLTPESCSSPIAAGCPLPLMDWIPLL